MVGIARLVYSILLTNENETNDRDPITGSEDRIIGADDSRVIGYFFFFQSGVQKEMYRSLNSHVKIIRTYNSTNSIPYDV